MLTRYHFTLMADTGESPCPEWAYRLYAALLEDAPEDFSRLVHRDAVTPLSQYLTTDRQGILHWNVSLLGSQSENALSGVLDNAEGFDLEHGGHISILTRERREIGDADTLFSLAEQSGRTHHLQICTPAAFKSRGQYLILPSTRLIVQSLIRKWNGCILDCPIEDEDGAGAEALVSGLHCTGFRLQDRVYYLKGKPIPGFTGSITLENRLDGFHRLLADALLRFSVYSGIGIKTALGMGGIERH